MRMKMTEETKEKLGQDFKPVPDGVRDLEVRQIKDEKESQKNNFYANVGFVILGGGNPGRWVWDRFMTSGNGIGRAAALFKAIFDADPTEGVKIGDQVDPYQWLKECEGHVVRSEVVLGVDQEGQERNYVGGSNGKGDGGGFKFEPSPLEKKKTAPPSRKSTGKVAPPSKAGSNGHGKTKPVPPSKKR